MQQPDTLERAYPQRVKGDKASEQCLRFAKRTCVPCVYEKAREASPAKPSVVTVWPRWWSALLAGYEGYGGAYDQSAQRYSSVLLPGRVRLRACHRSGDVAHLTGEAAMLCIACGAEMRIVRVEQDSAMNAAGYEHRTLACIRCQRTERRLAFSGEAASWPFECRWIPASWSAAKQPAGACPRLGGHEAKRARSVSMTPARRA